MLCECLEYECLKVYLVPCATTVPLGITSDVTGTVKMILEFDGAHTRTDIEVVSGQPITVPNVFNENYNHLVQFYKADGSIINDTCYKIKTMATIFTTVPASGGSVAWDDVTNKPADIINLSDILADLQAQIDGLDVDALMAMTVTIGDMPPAYPAGNSLVGVLPAGTEPVAVYIGTVLLANEEISTGAGAEGDPVTVILNNYTTYNGQTLTIIYKPTEI